MHRYYNNYFCDILKFANLSTSRKLKPPEYYQIYSDTTPPFLPVAGVGGRHARQLHRLAVKEEEAGQGQGGDEVHGKQELGDPGYVQLQPLHDVTPHQDAATRPGNYHSSCKYTNSVIKKSHTVTKWVREANKLANYVVKLITLGCYIPQ